MSMRQQTYAGSTNLDDDLRLAIERGELRLYFLPQIDLSTGLMVGVEALLRWQHPEWGTLPPATVVPIAEETGLIVPIGEWVVEEACRYARDWADTGTPIEMTVNLSHLQLVEPGVAARVGGILERFGVSPDRFVIDVRDSATVASDERAVASLGAMRALGMHVSIDDFGYDGQPMGVLRTLPADRLKLDRSLTRGVTEGHDERVMVASIVSLGRDLGMRVVAEGVETRSQRLEMTRLGCHDAQGHLWSPPLPPGSVLDQILGRDHELA
jgi:EAL domain-containing protein (putative c-di-GMP-specific phosphodiesterase class I)